MESVSVTPGSGLHARAPAPGPAPDKPRGRRAAVVVIGRNEGERLRLALASVVGRGIPVVYVDSGSRDESPGLARSLGCRVVELDLSRPLSAARARNEGFDEALRLQPESEWIQFLDGDCELAPDWLERGVAEFAQRRDTAVVCGRLRERRPEASLYNRLCRLEWDRPCGEVSECGGIMLVRTEAFRQVGGFDARIVAGEDPELCLRLRRAGWKIFRVDADMAVHDAAMLRFPQWWTRAVRTGHAYAQASALHGRSPDRYRVRECRSIWLWSFWLPALAALLAWPTRGWSLLALAAYPLQVLRIAWREARRGTKGLDALLYGAFCVLAKWPQLQGLIRYRRRRRDPQGPALIEYKQPPGAGARAEEAVPRKSASRPRYCIISPSRDEADYMRRTLDTVTGQTVPPDLWVIVDDGSTDRTPEILSDYVKRFPYIRVVRRENRGRRSVGPGVIEAFYAGLSTVDLSTFDYLCKLDLDLDLPHRYFEILLDRMEAHPRLGTCSGKAYFTDPKSGGLKSERCGDEMSVGMTKLYRRECFVEIAGFVQEVMWDGIDCHHCRMLGWMACSWDEPDLRFLHLRPMGSSQQGILKGRMRHGFGQHFMGTGLVYMTVSSIFRMSTRPWVIGGIAMWWGYVRSLLGRRRRYSDLEFRRFLRRYQWSCLFRGKRRATLKLDREGEAIWKARKTPGGESNLLGEMDAFGRS